MMLRRRIKYNHYLLVIILILLVATLLIIDHKLKASIIEIATAKAQILVTEKIHTIINQEIVTQIEYQDIVDIHKDQENRIVLIQPNTIILNKMMANSVVAITHELEQISEKSIEIPLGQITGSQILAGYGPKMKVKIMAVSQVKIEVLNKFEGAGINQTRHYIYFSIKSPVRVAVPLLDEEVQVSTMIPLAETIIIGEVPQTYVGLGNK